MGTSITPCTSKQSEPSPVKRILQRNNEKQEDLFEQRMHETVSAASKKPENIDKLKRLNSLTHAKRRLSSTKPKGRLALYPWSMFLCGVGIVIFKMGDDWNFRERSGSNFFANADPWSFVLVFFKIFIFCTCISLVSQRPSLKRDISGAKRRGPTLERRHTVADSSEMALVETRRVPQAIPETPEPSNAAATPKMSGSEKKKILLGIVREELHKNGMQKGNLAYKDCIRKLHEMCRTLIRVWRFSENIEIKACSRAWVRPGKNWCHTWNALRLQTQQSLSTFVPRPPDARCDTMWHSMTNYDTDARRNTDCLSYFY